MTLRSITTYEAETLEGIINHLRLNSLFKRVTGELVTQHEQNQHDVLPHTVLRETLITADEEYILDLPNTGSDPRYRVILLTGVENNEGGNNGA